uniref:Uncharacterized protein n=1 Tax=Accipiter nisus TaxID=211598 RepID=A0A8B9M9D3_9AVES
LETKRAQSARRVLPAWMEAAGDDAAGAGGRARPGPVRPRRLPRAGGGAAVYCMDEAELVDVALAVLAERGRRRRRRLPGDWPGCPAGGTAGCCLCPSGCSSREEQELQATPEEAPGSTASTGGGSGRSPAPPSPAGADAGRTGWEDSEDDALRYVREIFFG